MIGVACVALWLALVVWVGEIVFLSFVVAPTVFRVLPSATAGQVMGALFPVYYAVGTGAGVVAWCSALVLWRRQVPTLRRAILVALLTLMLGATAYAGGVIQPRAAALRPALHQAAVADDVRAEFGRLHGIAVALNAAVLLLGLACVGVAAGTTALREGP